MVDQSNRLGFQLVMPCAVPDGTKGFLFLFGQFFFGGDHNFPLGAPEEARPI